MATDKYQNELADIVLRLRAAGFESSISGEGAGRFVYVEHQHRAAEISKDAGVWFIELFEQPKEISVSDEMQDTIPIAVERVLDWLRNQ